MAKALRVEKGKEPTNIYEDSIFTGILHALGHSVKPFKDSNGKIVFEVSGDTNKTIEEIYRNCPIGSLDAMRSIKLMRSMIYNFRNRNGQ
jgi:hypothetical protein